MSGIRLSRPRSSSCRTLSNATIGASHNKSALQAALRWLVQRGNAYVVASDKEALKSRAQVLFQGRLVRAIRRILRSRGGTQFVGGNVSADKRETVCPSEVLHEIG